MGFFQKLFSKNETEPFVSAVILAAGKGKRMQAGSNKVFFEIGASPVLAHTIRAFEEAPLVREIILVTGEEDMVSAEHLVKDFGFQKVKKIVRGGAERQESSAIGISHLSEEAEVVLIHDGARPFVLPEEIERVAHKAKEMGAAVLGAPLRHTVKRVNENQVISETLDRQSLWTAFTPQGFLVPLIQEAAQYAKERGLFATDDASLVELMGRPVEMVSGSEMNIKITLPEDLQLAECILAAREGKA